MVDFKKRLRANTNEPAALALARAMREANLPVPELLSEIIEAPAFKSPADDMRARSDVLRGLGWPSRALHFAACAETQYAAICAIETWDPSRCAVVLAGAKGTGKTVAAAWWALGSKRVFHFVRAGELVRVGRFDKPGDTAAKMGDWLKARALCIDDLGAEYADAKGSFVADLDLLIDTFYADMRPLIITTNCDGKTFRERYGPRITDRINECATWAMVDGPSLRGGT